MEDCSFPGIEDALQQIDDLQRRDGGSVPIQALIHMQFRLMLPKRMANESVNEQKEIMRPG